MVDRQPIVFDAALKEMCQLPLQSSDSQNGTVSNLFVERSKVCAKSRAQSSN